MHRDESKITDELLAAGAAPDKMSKAVCELWLREIGSGSFSVLLHKDEEDEADLPDQLNEQRGDDQGNLDDEDQADDNVSQD